MKESLRRIFIGTVIGLTLLFTGMFAFATPAHAHGGGRTFGAFVLGAAVAGAVLHPRVVYAAPMYVPQPYVVQPQPVYVVQPPPPQLCRYTTVNIYTTDGQFIGQEPRRICQ